MISIFCAVACVYPFEADGPSAEGNLVIEGDIFIGGVSYFALSRVVALDDESPQLPVEGEVYVEDSNGKCYYSDTYDEKLGYVVDLATADPSLEYRLAVKVGGREYLSTWSKPEGSCIIDGLGYSIDYDSPNGLLQLQMSLHSNDGSRHFRYRYSEVWEYHAFAQAECYYIPPDKDHPNGQVRKFPYGENIYYCWKREASRGINLATTEQMSEDKLIDYPFRGIDRHDDRISILYKITLDVYPVSPDSYRYYENIKSVSSSTGDLFAPIPNAMRGNIRCTSDADEQVFGYIAVVRPQTESMYVACTGDVSDFYVRNYRDPDFEEEEVPVNRWSGYYRKGYLPMYTQEMQGTYWAKARCLDCRMAGGTKEKPVDWPNDHL